MYLRRLFIATVVCFLNANSQLHHINAFTIQTRSIRSNSATTSTANKVIRSYQHLQAIKINEDTSSASILNENDSDMTEKIRKLATTQYEEAMDYFMFELGNDIVFLSDQKEVSSYVQHQFDTVIFDCDGVLYRGGNNAIPESENALKSLISSWDKQVLFLTNNAEYSREQLCTKISTILNCDGLLTKEQMITSSYSTAKYLELQLCHNGDDRDDGEKDEKKMSENCNVLVIGSNGLCDEIKKFGFNVKSLSAIMEANMEPSSMDREDLASYSFTDEEEGCAGNVDAIVIGLDTNFTYRKLCIVTALLKRHPNALFIATNKDAFDVVDGFSGDENDKRNLPGNGSIVKSVEVASERKSINVGKPSNVLGDLLRSEYELNCERTLMVGDRLDTDVKFGKDSGMKTALVLTGCTTAEKLMEVGVGTDDEPLPHMVFPHMGMMMSDGE